MSESVTTNSSDWLAGYHQALEDAATFYLNNVPYRNQATNEWVMAEAGQAPTERRILVANAIRSMKERWL